MGAAPAGVRMPRVPVAQIDVAIGCLFDSAVYGWVSSTVLVTPSAVTS